MAALDADALVRALACATAAFILANQLDELFVDANYLLRGLGRRARRIIPLWELEAAPPKRVAILVPAWKEAEVIEQMLDKNLGTLDYDRSSYDIFCGTYANDPETHAQVSKVVRRTRNVHEVVVPHDGPTSKADCLNWVYQGVVLHEQRSGRRFDVLLMHDAEDVIHPLSLRLYATLIPAYDFVQTPVFSLGVAQRSLVAGTYIDEFGEFHLKDMLVRQAIGGLVPSAGVGSAFARDAFDDIARRKDQRTFNPESLTEDYDIGLAFCLAGKKTCFACRTVVRPSGHGEEYIATREYFPDRIRASIRQRSRWVLGITLQSWESVGWKGTLPVLYCLWRDRKALISNVAVLVAYALVLYAAVRAGVGWATGSPFGMERMFPAGSLLRRLLVLNLAMLAWRAGMKAWLVRRLYGTAHALLCAPRIVLGNLISLAATGRAAVQYVRHRITGEPLRWLKTAHTFPSPEALSTAKPRSDRA